MIILVVYPSILCKDLLLINFSFDQILFHLPKYRYFYMYYTTANICFDIVSISKFIDISFDIKEIAFVCNSWRNYGWRLIVPKWTFDNSPAQRFRQPNCFLCKVLFDDGSFAALWDTNFGKDTGWRIMHFVAKRNLNLWIKQLAIVINLIQKISNKKYILHSWKYCLILWI